METVSLLRPCLSSSLNRTWCSADKPLPCPAEGSQVSWMPFSVHCESAEKCLMAMQRAAKYLARLRLMVGDELTDLVARKPWIVPHLAQLETQRAGRVVPDGPTARAAVSHSCLPCLDSPLAEGLNRGRLLARKPWLLPHVAQMEMQRAGRIMPDGFSAWAYTCPQ